MTQLLIRSLVLLNALLYWSNFPVGFYSSNQTVKPLYWYGVTIATAVIVGMLTRLGRVRTELLVFLAWLAIFLGYDGLIAIEHLEDANARQALVDALEAAALMISFLVLFDAAPRTARLALLLAVLIGVPLNCFDFVTSTWTTTPGRAAGLYLNSNFSGYMLILSMTGALPLVPKRIRIPFCLFAGVGVLVTFSRSSWMIWAAVMVAMGFAGQLDSARKSRNVVILGGVSVVLVYMLLTGGLLDKINSMEIAKLTPDVVERLGGGDGAFNDASALSRGEAVLHSLDAFAEHPWFGAGLGSTRAWDVPPHNLYLLRAAEGGIVGLAIFLALFVVLLPTSTINGRLLLLIFALLSLFYHNGLDDPPILAMLAWVAVQSGRGNGQEERVIAKEKVAMDSM